MPTRRGALIGLASATFTGCVTVSTESGGGDPSDREQDSGPESSASPHTTIPANGGGSGIGASDLDVLENELLSMINERRESLDGAPPLSASGTLAEKLRPVAKEHAELMAEVGRVERDIDGSSLLGTMEDTNCSVPHDTMIHEFADGESAIVDAADVSGRGPTELSGVFVERWLGTDLVRGLVLADRANLAVPGAALRGGTVLVTVIFC